MRLILWFSAATMAASILLLSGCASSTEETTKQHSTTQTSSPAEQPAKQERTPDTVTVQVQDSQKPVYEKEPAPSSTVASFAVQIGAYKLSDNADRVAALARERFGKTVRTIPDKVGDLYKVMVGEFMLKDEARKFRDEMAQKFPGDYKDAWVAELPRQ